MKPSIRRASSADLTAVLAVEASRPTAPGWSREHFEAELSGARGLLLVAELSGKVVGHACLWRVPPEAQILSVVVAPDSGRRGVGAALLAGLLDAARAEGLEKASLEVSAENAPALALYRRAGFQIVGRRPKFYNDGSDAVLMDLALR